MAAVATIIIPCGLYHIPLLPRALESARSQTVPVNVHYEVDYRRERPGVLRNRMAKQATTPFLVFLDADDYLDASFVARALSYYTKKGTYVYTDYYGDGVPNQAPPELPFWSGYAHAVTTLFPTALFNALGGFDTQHPFEDTDFYLKAIGEGVCPVYCPEPLFHYTSDGQRANEARNSSDYHAMRRDLYVRYSHTRGMLMSCGCTGVQNTITQLSAPFEGAILAKALYSPMRQIGRVTGRVYDRPAHMGAAMYVDAKDVAASPNWWQPVIDLNVLSPDVDMVLSLAGKS